MDKNKKGDKQEKWNNQYENIWRSWCCKCQQGEKTKETKNIG